MQLFRITQQRARAAAFDGIGASLYPGRWNERGSRAVYTTTRISLGILEIVVQASDAPLVGYVAYPMRVPDDLLMRIDRLLLSPTWRTADLGRAECRLQGERWRSAAGSLGLIVPSAVAPEAFDFGEVNVILNPLHPAFAEVGFDEPIPLDIDTRLRKAFSRLPALPKRASRKRAGPGRPKR